MTKESNPVEIVSEKLFEDEAFFGDLIGGQDQKKQDGLVALLNLFAEAISVGVEAGPYSEISDIVTEPTGSMKKKILTWSKQHYI